MFLRHALYVSKSKNIYKNINTKGEMSILVILYL